MKPIWQRNTGITAALGIRLNLSDKKIENKKIVFIELVNRSWAEY